MALTKVVANKRCLAIQNFDNPSLMFKKYSILLDGDSSLTITVPYTTYYNGEYYMLSLANWSFRGVNVKPRDIILNKGDCVYNYESDRYELKVITSVVKIDNYHEMNDYFRDKKLYKILNIYIDSVANDATNGLHANVKIYYLEKK